MNSSIPKEKQKQYADYVKQITPTHSLPMNMAKAFLTGGNLCRWADYNKFCKIQRIRPGYGRYLVFCYPGFHQCYSYWI